MALLLLSLLLQKTLWLPLMILLGVAIGPFMAYSYPWGMQTHIFIGMGFLFAIVMMGYGIKYRTVYKGRVLFILGFWLWASIGLFYGLSVGT